MYSLGRGGIRATFGPLYADNEAQHKRLRGSDAQNIRLEAEHEGYPMKCWHWNWKVFLLLLLLLLQTTIC